MEELSGRIPTPEELDEWLKTTELPPLIDTSDENRIARIKSISWVDTKYGRKLKFELEFVDNNERKGALLSKSLARAFVIQANTKNLVELIDKEVVVKRVMVSTPQGVRDKATIVLKQPVKSEQNTM